jgi:hypothetical protein
MNTSPPLVSIGLPVHNGARYLRAAIDSVLAQTFSDFELIIADDASSDGTVEIARAYAAADPRVRFCPNERRLGLAENHNRVVELAPPGATSTGWGPTTRTTGASSSVASKHSRPTPAACWRPRSSG